MHHFMKSILKLIMLLSVNVLMIAVIALPASMGETPEQFFRGKVITLNGGSRLQSENLAYKAKPDGLTMLLADPVAIALNTWLKEPGAVYDVAKFNWLGQ